MSGVTSSSEREASEILLEAGLERAISFGAGIERVVMTAWEPAPGGAGSAVRVGPRTAHR